MRLLSFAALAICTASLVYACSSSSSGGSHDGGATGDVGVPPAEGGGYCCPPDPEPSCTMFYGGFSATATCLQMQNGMPLPNDPSWKLVTDSHGCEMWTSMLGPNSQICGAPDASAPQDSGAKDSGASDTGAAGDGGSFDASAE